MKTLFKILVVALILGSATTVRSQAFEQGNMVFSAGYGWPNLGKVFFSAAYKSYENYNVTGMGPFHAKFEYALSDNFGAGVSVNLVSYEISYTEEGVNELGQPVDYSYSTKVMGWSALGRINIHIGDNDDIDPYVGIGIGYRKTNYTFKSTPQNPYWDENIKGINPFGFELSAGLRYYVMPMVGIFAEVGVTKSLAQLGVSFKI